MFFRLKEAEPLIPALFSMLMLSRQEITAISEIRKSKGSAQIITKKLDQPPKKKGWFSRKPKK